MSRDRGLLTLMLLYGAASLVHFIHNAVYWGLYPNMPVWLTPLGVLASWLVIAGTGAVGYWLLRKGLTLAGLTAIILCELRPTLRRNWSVLAAERLPATTAPLTDLGSFVDAPNEKSRHGTGESHGNHPPVWCHVLFSHSCRGGYERSQRTPAPPSRVGLLGSGMRSRIRW